MVKAGGTPWCVKTCPSQALMYGDREEILAEAKTRLAALQDRYPNARIYGETEAGGLGVIMVLPDAPEKLNLPANPDVPIALNAWQKMVQPVSMGLTGLSVVVTGLAAVIARRNHMRELDQIHQEEAAQTDADGEGTDVDLDASVDSGIEEEESNHGHANDGTHTRSQGFALQCRAENHPCRAGLFVLYSAGHRPDPLLAAALAWAAGGGSRLLHRIGAVMFMARAHSLSDL